MYLKNRLSAPLLLLIIAITLISLLGSACTQENASASSEPIPLTETSLTPLLLSDAMPLPDVYSSLAYYARYEGIDGESTDDGHNNWIEILSIVWGAQQSAAGASGPSRRRGAASVEDLVITLLYEKAAPKLEEKCLKGSVIPKLEIELTNTAGETPKTFLKYELKNVLITDFDVSGMAESGMPPMFTVANNFEEIKVTYTEYDESGSSKGDVEYTYKVEPGGG